MSLTTFLFGSKKTPQQVGTLSVFVLEGRNLRAGYLGMKRDVYCEVRLVSTVGNFIKLEKTRISPKTLAPNWMSPPEEHLFPVAIPGGDELEVRVYDKVQLGNNELLGEFKLTVRQHIGQQVLDNWYTLSCASAPVGGNGELHLVTMYHGDQQVPPPAPPPGWTLAYDKQGRLHYVCAANGLTSWVYPAAPVAAPPQYPPQQYNAAPAAPAEVYYPPAAVPSAPSAPSAPPAGGMYPPMPAPTDDMTAFLTSNGLAHLVPVFSKERIDMMVLRSMTEADMTSLGLAFGDKKKLLMLTGR